MRKTTLAAFEHHDMPFEKIVEMLQPERDLSRNPIFQVMFSFQVPELEPVKNTQEKPVNLSQEIVSSVTAGSHVDLSLEVKDDAGQILIGMVYNTDLFNAATIRQMLDHYRRLLGSCLANADTDIGQLAMLSDDEKQLMLYHWNDNRKNYAEDETLHSLFEQQDIIP